MSAKSMYAASTIFTLGWWLFLDALVVQRRLGQLPEPSLVDWLPASLGLAGFVAMLTLPADVLAHELMPGARYSLASGYARHCSKCGLFVAMVTSFSSIMIAVASMQTRYIDGVDALVKESASYSAWPALATVLQTLAMMTSALIILFHRLQAATPTFQ